MTTKDSLEEFKQYLKMKDYSIVYINPVSLYLNYCQLNKIDYKKITFKQITTFILHLKKKYSNGYINNYFNAIRCFYSFLEDSGVKSSSLKEFQKIRFLKTERKIKEAFTRKEMDDLLSKAMTCADVDMSPYKIRAILYFMFYTGIRKTEIRNLMRKDINLEEKTVIIRVPNKSKEERLCLFNDKTAEYLHQVFTLEPEILNAFNLTSTSLRYLFEYLQNYCKEDKMITPHMMRHSFTNMLAEKGIDIRVAQQLLGHKNMLTTMIYYNPTRNTLKKIYREKVG